MKITSAEFISSSTRYEQCPKADKAEFAFIGRSNVGKSSLINMLTGKKNLARISAKPGKTQLINHFLINKDWYLVDLPGYGYAKVSKQKRAEFDQMISKYIIHRENLVCVFVLADLSIPPQEIDLDFMNNLGKKEIPFCIVFTKSDRLSANERAKHLSVYQKELLKFWEEIPQYFVTSSEKQTGKSEILEFLAHYIELFKENYKAQ